MVRRRVSAVSNHEAEMPDPGLHPSRRARCALLRMRVKVSQNRTTMTAEPTETVSAAGFPLEKVPLEIYVPPAKPSLVGLSRTELADRLGEIGVQPSQRKMRVQQLWHWMYFRGAQSFDEMTSISKDTRAQLEGHFTVAR